MEKQTSFAQAVYAGKKKQTRRERFLVEQGYEWYVELGLYRCGARFYEPYDGSFMQPDPIGQGGGLNIYGYCGNDPINGSDPSGYSDFLGGDNIALSTGSNIPGNPVYNVYVADGFNSSSGGGPSSGGSSSFGSPSIDGAIPNGYSSYPSNSTGTDSYSNDFDRMIITGSIDAYLPYQFTLPTSTHLFFSSYFNQKGIGRIGILGTDTDSPIHTYNDKGWSPNTSLRIGINGKPTPPPGPSFDANSVAYGVRAPNLRAYGIDLGDYETQFVPGTGKDVTSQMLDAGHSELGPGGTGLSAYGESSTYQNELLGAGIEIDKHGYAYPSIGPGAAPITVISVYWPFSGH